MYKCKKGSAVLAVVVLALAISLVAGTFYVANSDNLITGQTIGTQTIGVCNISVTETINNIGHDYVCDGEHGFIIKEDNISVNCQGHSITCVANCNGTAGFLIGDYEGVNITDCVIKNFGDGFKLYDNAYDNFIGPDNILINNSDGVDINNATFNKVNHNYILNSTACGVNISDMNNNATNYSSSANRIWDNYIINSSTGVGGCNDATSYNYWNLGKNASHGFDPNVTNIINGTYLGGNYWNSYEGEDITGDGLGDTGIPYKAGGILASTIGDEHPLVDACALPGTVCGVVTCPAGNLTADSGGEGIAIVCDDSVLDCQGTTLIGNSSLTGWQDHMRGIEIIGVDNVTIKNCEILNFTYGIYIRDAENVTIENNFVHDNNATGIYLGEFTEGATVRDNTVSNEFSTHQSKGIWLRSASPHENIGNGTNNNISDNIVRNHTSVGIYVSDESDYNLLEHNDVYYNYHGGVINNSDATTLSNNSFYNSSDHGLWIYYSDDTVFEGSPLLNLFYDNVDSGLKYEYSSSSAPVLGKSYRNYDGMHIRYSNPNVGNGNLSNINSYDNQVSGIFLLNSSNVDIGSVNISGNGIGIYLNMANGTTFAEGHDIIIFNNTEGFRIFNSHSNNLTSDLYTVEMYNNSVNLDVRDSDNNILSGMKIYDADVIGINVSDSDYNTIFNNYFNNTNNAFDNNTNYWNTSYDCSITDYENIMMGTCQGGNYWAGSNGYSGEDYSGDGIGDTEVPYNNSNNITGGDYLPLISEGNISCGTFTTDIALNQNLTNNGTCFTINADNLNVNCSGYSIIGNGSGTAIYSSGQNGITIENCKIENFNYGIRVTNGQNFTLRSNTILNSSDSNVRFRNVNNSIVDNCTLSEGGSGISIKESSYCTFTNNTCNNNTQGFRVYINNTYNNITSNTVINNTRGLYLYGGSNNNIIKSNTITDNSYGIVLEEDISSNLIYNNYFNNTNNAVDNGNQSYWNSTYFCDQSNLNIVDQPCWGGNYWVNYAGADDGSGLGSGIYPYNNSEDGIGDTLIPYNNSGNLTGGGDYLPLVELPIECGDVTYSITLTKNLTSTGTCFNVLANGITINFNGYSITGDGTGIGVNISSYSNVTVQGGNINNFSTAIYVDPATGITVNNMNLSFTDKAILFEQIDDSVIQNNRMFNNTWAIYLNDSDRNNITSNTIYDNTYAVDIVSSNSDNLKLNTMYDNVQGIYLTNVYNSTIVNNTLTNFTGKALYFDQSYLNTVTNNTITLNVYGLDLSSSYNNTIYNNYFNNTNNAVDDGTYSNYWNSSYDCTTTSIIGGDCQGGNFWSDYTGKDQGSGAYPYNSSEDEIGDTQIPYNKNITGGDYLPLTSEKEILGTCPLEISNDYIMNESINCDGDNGITITADDVTLDCNGYSLNGTGVGAGILVDNQDNIVIKNCNITNFYYGIELLNTNNVQIIEDNWIQYNDFYGIYLFQASNTLINDSSIIDDNNGVYMISSSDTTISSNTIDLNKKFYGIYSFGSSGNTISDNSMTDNYHGIYFVNSDNANVNNNNVTLSDVYSLFMHSTTDSGTFVGNEFSNALEGIRIKGNSNYNTFTNNTVQHHTDYGIRSTDSRGNDFTSNVFYNNSNSNTYNIYLSNSANYEFTSNNITGPSTGFAAFNATSLTFTFNGNVNSGVSPCMLVNDSTGITINYNNISNDLELNNIPGSTINYNTIIDTTIIAGSDNLTITGNNITAELNITNSDNFGLNSNTLVDNYIYDTTGSTVSGNTLSTLEIVDFSNGTISNNEVDNSATTVFNFQNVDSSNIIDNDIQDSGIAMFLSNSDNNNIYDNWLKDNDFGLNLTSSSSNTIYNNYFRNDGNVFDDTGNIWNINNTCDTPNIVGGPCKGGNFYSDYYGLDNGANNREQGDGIGDEPYYYAVSSSNAQDTEPLVLYVARQYFAPDDTTTLALTATGSISGELSDEEVVPNEVQTITYSNSAGTDYYLQIVGLFNQSDVHAEDLIVHYDENRTFVNKTGVTGEISNYTVYLNHDGRMDAGIRICDDATNLSTVTHNCTGGTNKTTFPTTHLGMQLRAEGDLYVIENVTDTTIGFALIFENDTCDYDAYHDITMTEDMNCSGTAVNVEADNITVDCDGKTLTGDGVGNDNGIFITGVNYTTVQNCVINNFKRGVYIVASEGNTIKSNNIDSNNISSSLGIYIYSADSNNISNNSIVESESSGIRIDTSANNNLVSSNTIEDSSNGIDLKSSSSNNTLISNTVNNNSLNGFLLDSSSNNNLTSNTGKYNGRYGIYLDSSSNNVLTSNTVNNNSWHGFYLESSSNNTVTSNTGKYNGYYGISLSDSHNNTITSNTFNDNADDGIIISYSSNNTVTSNTVKYNDRYGIYFKVSSNNTAYDNYFENDNNAKDDGSTNYWNTTYNCSIANFTNIVGGTCQGGNYWSNYNGTDDGNGTYPYNVTPWTTPDDGIGDTEIPYNNSGSMSGGADYLPLVISSVCGDGTKEGLEECDGTDFGTASCPDYGYLYGSLICTGCTIDSSGCTNVTTGNGNGGVGGGGGGGGGAAAAVVEEVNCTQSWSCYSWSECVDGTQTRTCYDLNDCENLLASGDVDNVIERNKPSESKSCELEVIFITPEENITPTVPEPEVPPAPIEPSPYTTLLLSGLAVLLIFGGFIAYMEYGRTTARLRRKIKKTKAMMSEETVEALKQEYKGIYNLYLKLSEKDKQNFYTSVNNLRSTIEGQLKAEKLVEKMLRGSGKGSLQNQKKNYLKIYKEYQKLAPRSQEKYYPQIVNLREQLESGKAA